MTHPALHPRRLGADAPFDPDRICALPAESSAGLGAGEPQWSSTPLLDPALTFRLHSNPTATRLIHLDFDGHTTTGTVWNNSTMGASFTSPAYDLDGNPGSFNSTELARIQQIWQRVAADFAAFDVNVTTQAPPTDWLMRSSSSDSAYGIRVVITNYGPSAGSAGGIASVGSFTASSDTPAFVYNISVTGVSEAISHEVGHTLGLSHDGTGSTAYYSGHGSGETGWAPIMGAAYNKSVSTWDQGIYSGSNNGGSSANYGQGPDDIAIILSRNGFGQTPDLIGNGPASAAPLTVSGGSVSQFGTIESRSDMDWYSFQLLDSGSLNLSFSPYWTRSHVDGDGLWGGETQTIMAPTSDINSTTAWADNGANLDLWAGLYSSGGDLLSSSDPAGLAASLSHDGLAPGRYYLALDGVGYGDPTAATPTGYSDAASLGHYAISGTIVHAADNSGPGSGGEPPPPTPALPTLTIADRSQSEGTGTTPSLVEVTVNLSAPASSEVSVRYSTADGTAIAGSDYVATSGTLRFAAGSTSASIALAVSADASVEADETLLINLTDASGAVIADGQALVTIVNDDRPPKRRGPAKAAASRDPLTGASLRAEPGAGAPGNDRRSDGPPLWLADPAALLGGGARIIAPGWAEAERNGPLLPLASGWRPDQTISGATEALMAGGDAAIARAIGGDAWRLLEL